MNKYDIFKLCSLNWLTILKVNYRDKKTATLQPKAGECGGTTIQSLRSPCAAKLQVQRYRMWELRTPLRTGISQAHSLGHYVTSSWEALKEKAPSSIIKQWVPKNHWHCFNQDLVTGRQVIISLDYRSTWLGSFSISGVPLMFHYWIVQQTASGWPLK